ncbi:regulator of chromosome condensation 1/beta-lactamase-inhibitor protein II [Bombardia bombarda]|uniref:Regulator of chromosome condensation 1/beta-lactamase-inhibitor protein II n=1 Tax=Bombardia bombarda TaxID=252184 RepID=A0AA39XAX1_9PEZI|nr:regulator of chromosome condensation 1/beta-lactamase-inhibitor protein II [Bombardia bombarda]
MLVIFALGSNGSGQLGIGHNEDVSVPKQVDFHPDITSPPSSLAKIAAGGNHTLLLSTAGELYWSGDSSTGACGKVTPEQRSLPPQFQAVDLPFQEAVGHAAATWEASIITRLDSQGEATKVYTFGAGTKGELGLGDFIVRTPTPSEIPNFPPPDTHVVDLAACMGHVVAVLSNGEAWGWGNGRKGQLGAPDSVIVNSPRKIIAADVGGFHVARAVCGREFTCLFGAPGSGDICVLGSDKWDVKAGAPSRVPDWEDVGAGWGNVFVLAKEGGLVSWGRDDHGQIAPAELTAGAGARVRRIAVGSEHALALSEDGEVTAWGWGEHGNCGPIGKKTDDTAKKGQKNAIASSKFIPPGSEITAIGAGCATSWVAIEIPT